MIAAIGKVRINRPIEEVWDRLSELEWLVTVNMFHHRARFETAQKRGKGTRLVVYHRLFGGPAWARYIRITHWEECVRIGWVETDSISLRHIFPHSQQFRLQSLGPSTTLLTDEVRGSLNMPIGERLFDRLAQKLLVERAVRQECASFRRQLSRNLVAK